MVQAAVAFVGYKDGPAGGERTAEFAERAFLSHNSKLHVLFLEDMAG